MDAAVDAWVLRALAPCDAVRAVVLRQTAPLLRPLLRHRQARIAVHGATSVLLTLVLTALAPLVLLTLGPLVLGVPHLLADARYLVVRQGLASRRGFWLAIVPCLVLTLVQPSVAWGACAVAAAALIARAPWLGKACVVCACALAWACARHLGARADVWLAHGHNLVALAFCVAWARGKKRELWPALALFALGTGLIFSGRLELALFRFGSLAPSQVALDAGDLVRTLSPVAEPVWALRWLLFFAFAQSVHYAVWLRLLPEEDRARRGVRSFAASYRALTADVGTALVLVAIALTLVLVVAAALDVGAAREGYLRLALFHAPLELAVATLLALEGRRVARAG